jgi:polyferredoxin/tetratricopeptide (TPR) repeat protein
MTCQKPTNPISLDLEGRVGGAGVSDAAPAGARAGSGRTVSLGVLPSTGNRPARSKSATRRAFALVLVHVAFAAHIAWWRFKGDVLTPVEPSESAFTLEQGLVNAGFVFFVSAILLQLVFGRFMCGWACHIVALQDLSAWLLKKVGIRPHPFRSRLLMWAPLILAFYLFLWPTIKREWLHPLAASHAPWLADLMGRPNPFPPQGFVPHFITDDFWATFASVGVAIPFLLVCCGLCVYFLGAKGYCTYGCPYGGFFTPIDRLSPGRIIVDHDKCEGCGHCTAVCTSNVRVHEEIKSHGMVMDPGCMKCLDCVSVCPNEALRFGFTLPAVLKKPLPLAEAKGQRKKSTGWKPVPPVPAKPKSKRAFDLSWPEEIGLAAVFLGTFWSVRGAYEVFPLLFAMGIAGCAAFLVFKAWRASTGGPEQAKGVRALGLQLRNMGRVTGSGWVFIAATSALFALIAHTGVVTYHIVRGDRLFDAAAMSKESLLASPPAAVPEEKKAMALRALEYYKVAAPMSRGGIALFANGFVERNSALLFLMAGDPASSEAALRRITVSHGEQDNIAVDISRLMDVQGKGDERRAMVDQTLTRRPEFWALRERRAAEWMGAGRAADVLSDADAAMAKIEDHWSTRVARARTQMIAAWALGAMDRKDEAFDRLKLAAATAPHHAAARAGLGMAYLQIKGDPASALPELEAAVDNDPGNPERRFLLGRVLLDSGKTDRAVENFTIARKASGEDPRLIEAVGQLLRQSGNAAAAAKWAE